MKIITLCGSVKFKDEFDNINKMLTLQGNVVLSCGIWEWIDDSDKRKKMLNKIHKRKIDLSDEIFVINKNGYIGKSTASEIKYAMKTGKKIRYLKFPKI